MLEYLIYYQELMKQDTQNKLQLVDKLVEECIENVDEVKLTKKTLAKAENKHQCSSCTLYIVLFSIIFTISIGFRTYFIYYKYMNRISFTKST